MPGGLRKIGWARPDSVATVRGRMSASSLRRLRPYVTPYRRQMLVMLGSATAALAAGTAIPLVTKRVIDGPLAEGHRGAILPLALLAAALGLVEAGLLFLRRYILARACTGMESQMRDDFYAHLQRLPVEFHDGWPSGQLLSRALADIATLRRFIGYGLIFLVVNVVTFVGVIVLLVQLDPLMASVTALSAVPVVLLSRRFTREYHSVARSLQDEEGDLTTVVEEGAQGIRVVKAFGRADMLGARYRIGARRVQNISLETVRLRGRFYALLGLVPNLTLAAVLGFGAVAVSQGRLSLGGLVAFVSLLLMLVWPVESLGEILAMAEEASAATERIFEVFDIVPSVADRPGAVALDRCRGLLRFEGVCFTYPGQTEPVLRGVDLELRPGETVAVVGRTGSGKTTLVSLVPRLYDVSAGRVLIDGHDVRELALTSLRRHVAVAFEDPILFSASVRENLLLGMPDATMDEIAIAIDTAQAGFVYDLPWGLDTRVGEQGLSLSGGQRQRLALARAVIGKPALLVLDDPLSALDVHTEALVEEALARVLSGTTALVVAHRPSTVALADRVVFLDRGRIAASGTHSELLARVPAYRAVLTQEMPAGMGASAGDGDEELAG